MDEQVRNQEVPQHQPSEIEMVMTEQKMKKGKLWRTLLTALIVILALFALVAAILFVMAEKDEISPVMAEAFLQAVVAEDNDAAYALMYPGLQTREAFAGGFREVCALWETYGGGENFTLERTGWRLDSQNGIKQWTVEYDVTSGETPFSLRLLRAEQEELSGLVGAYLSIPTLPGEQ